jgi:hypothetical protein
LEGKICQLQNAIFTDNATLEVLGENGTFRINVAKMRSSKIRKEENQA